ncbi:hypothetical protein J2125_000793 [Erwinia toletana]|uniref:PKD/Chitinase domain-containing protein n=1 Tax=Winslowiella toletana TaxID=92490 RepID=A0ABS4P4N6_9GAMM|nr:Ig-like domain-containing protein [Winslowiella toletana]MBP2167601.1 hypothetical protein [Winslowiella toletana]
MAQLNEGRVDIISRDNGTLISQATGGANHTVMLTEPSVVKINGTRAMVVEFERQGNDLILHMRDGSVVRYQQFFFDDVDGSHSELVFDDGVNPPEHALFPVTTEMTDATTAMAITPTYESLGNLEPLLLADNEISGGVITAAGIGALGLVGLGVAAAGGGGGGGGGGGDTTPTPVQPTITINPFAGDNILDAGEKGSSQTISGTTTNVEAGRTVTITLGGVTYTTTVAADGSWSVAVPPAALQALANGSTTIAVSVTDAAGTAASDTQAITVTGPVVEVPTITIGAFAGDNILDADEKGSSQAISGTTTNVEAGRTVTITLGGVTYTTTVAANGSWSVNVPSTALQALAEGATTINASVSNSAGATASDSQAITVTGGDNEQPTLTLNDFAGDNVLDGAEKQIDQLLSGTTTNVEAGRTVTITLGGQTYSTLVQANGSWSVLVPSAALEALTAGTTTISASVSNAAGNSASDSSALVVQPDTAGSIALEPISDDGYLGAGEVAAGLVISGTTTGVTAGSIVTVSFNGNNYTAIVNADGSWSATIPSPALSALPDGVLTVSASVTDSNGDLISNSGQLNVLINSSPDATIDPPFGGDGTLNGDEASNDQTIGGNTGVTGPGQTVVVTIGGNDYNAPVANDGSWTVTIPAQDLGNLPQGGANPIIVVVTDPAGNTSTSTTPLVVDTLPPALTPGVPISGDGYLNQQEQAQPLIIGGSGEANASIVVTLAGVNYPATVDSTGQWSVTVPANTLADGSYTVAITATDGAGNTTTVNSPLTVIADPANFPTITLNPFAGDGILDGAEQQTEQFITGTTDAPQGQTITVTLGNTSYTGIVESDGSWSVSVPASALAGLNNGTQNFTVSVNDAAGNTSTSDGSFDVDTTLAAIALDPLSGDGYLNAQEATSDLTVSGTSGNVAAGSVVSFVIGATTYTAIVQADGSWSTTVPSAVLANLPDGPLTITATTPGANGATITADGTLNVVIASQPAATIDPPFGGDGALNGNEVSTDQTISGNTGVNAPGQTVQVTLGGNNYTALVGSDGNWSVTIPATDLGDLPQGSNNPLVVAVTDAAGNTSTSTTPLLVDTVAPALGLDDPISGNGYLNALEQGQPLVIVGSGEADTSIVVTLNGVDYPATVTSGGQWTVTIPAADLANIADGNYSVGIVASDAAGNTTATSAPLVVDTQSPPLALTTPISGDGYLNQQEQAEPLIIAGSGEAGANIVVTLDEVDYPATVDSDGKWSVTVPANTLGDGSYNVAITTTDGAGNATTVNSPLTVIASPANQPTLTVDPLTGDGVLDGAEQQTEQFLTGTTTNVQHGQVVTVTLGGESYTGVVQASGAWSVSIPASALEGLTNGTQNYTVSVDDAAGNNASDTGSFVVDNTVGAIALDPLSGDGYLNALEAESDLTVSGTSSNVAAGSTVSFVIGTTTYTAIVQANGSWSTTVPSTVLANLPDGPLTITATTPGANGATISADGTLNVAINDLPQANIDTPFTDAILSGDESRSDQTLTGNTGATGDGQTVTVTIGGVDYPVQVATDGSWSLLVPSTALQNLPEGPTTIVVAVSDAAGNSNTSTTTVRVDTLPPALDIEPISEDGRVNGSEQNQPLLIEGHAEAGSTVIVTLDGVDYPATIDASGYWTVNVPSAVLQGLIDGTYPVSVTASDSAGNSTTQLSSIILSTSAPAFTLAPVAGDGMLNSIEQGVPLELNGTGTPGDSVQVTLNGKSYSAIVDGNNNWSVNVPTGDLAALNNGSSYTVAVTVTDPAGNSASQQTGLVIDTSAPVVTLNPVAVDGILNASEQTQPLIVGGNGTAGDTITVTLNQVEYSVVVGQNGQWEVTIPAADLTNLPGGNNPLTVEARDPAGNTSTQSTNLLVDTAAPALELNPIAVDGTVNASEQGQPLLISGSGSAGDIISLTLNGENYTATVGSDNQWSVSVPVSALGAIADGTYPLTVTATNASGNSSSTSSNLTFDTATPALTVEPVSDGYLNNQERDENLTINGTGDAGDNVTVTLNNVDYPAVVNSDGNWSVQIPPAVLALLPDGPYTVSVTVVDAVGNTNTSTSPLIVAADPANLPTISVDPFTGDGQLNGAEQGESQILTGTTTNVQAGQLVTVLLNGVPYTGEVKAGGAWSVNIPASAFAGLQNSTQTFDVSVSDLAGNPATGSETFTVDNSFSALAIGIISGDDYLNAIEAQSDLTISGSSNNVAEGTTVTVTLNNIAYTGTVDADGKWSIIVPTADLQVLPDGPLTVTATSTDSNNNQVTSENTLNVAINTLPQPTLDTPFGDGVLSADEAQNPQTLSGTTGVIADGQQVFVTVGGVQYAALVDGQGNWTVTIPPATLQNLPDGNANVVVVVVSDVAGNSDTLTTPVVVDSTPPDIALNPVSGDGIINATEQGLPLAISGSTEAGSTVVVTLNGIAYPAIVAASGSWSATVPASALQALTDGKYDISITATDANGNSATVLTPVTLDTSAPAFTVAVIAGDGTLNASEQAQPLAINGTGVAGDSVSVILNGNSYSATVGADGQWTVNVPAADLATLTDGVYPVRITVSDAAGNSTTQQVSLPVDITPPALTLNPPSGDGILSSAEQGQPLLLNGSGESGDNITVSLNGKSYQATVGVNGQWSLEVPAVDLAGLSEGANPLSVTTRDSAGNITTVQSSLTLDTTAPTLTVAINTFAGNGIVDGAERAVDQILSGTTNAEAGQTVTVTLNGVSYSGLVLAGGAWNVTIPAGAMAGLNDGSQTLAVSVTNAAGNSTSVSDNYTINTSGSSLAIAPVSDGYLNASEQGAALSISGQSTNVTAGSIVVVTVNGVDYNATVNADGSWTATVPAGALSLVADGPLAISATVNDAAGNPVTSTSSVTVLADTLPTVTINPSFGDGSLNADDIAANGTLTGSTGVAGEGQTVSVNFDGTTYNGTVASDGSWTISIPAAALQELQQGTTSFTVTVGDVAGNTATGNGSVLVDTLPPALLVGVLSGDGVVNATELGQPLAVSGTGENGATIVVSFAGTPYTTTVDTNGSWTLNIPADALSGLTNGSYDLTVTATDSAGNSTQQPASFTVKADAASLPTISFDAFAGNNVVDGAEQQTAQTLSGVTTNVEAGQTVTITLDGAIYTAIVQPSGAWSIAIPASALQDLANGDNSLVVAVSDAAGNSISNTLDFSVNNALSGLAVDPVSGDGYLNATEAGQDLLISGTSQNVATGSTVTIEFNNQTFTAEVGANGVWSVAIPPAALAGLTDGPTTVNVSATDAAGNPVSSDATLNVQINELPDATILPPFGDSILNAAEAGSTQTLRGSTGKAGDGQQVSVNINGVDYNGLVDSDGNWTVSLSPTVLQTLGAGSMVVTVTDAAGNQDQVSAPFSVDLIPPTLTIDTIAGDGRVNAAESVAAIAISGTTTAQAGQIVTITLNGQSYTATVNASGVWSLDLPAGALAGISNGSYTLTATVTDAAGNPTSSSSAVTVETAALVPTFNTPFTDGYLNSAEAQQPQTLTGTTGASGAGQSVVVNIGGTDYNAQVDASGNWSLVLQPATLQDLSSGNLPIVVTVTDGSGNQGVIDSTASVDFQAPTLTISTIAGDNIINAAEYQQVVAVSGTASVTEAGQQVTVTFNGVSYQTLVQSDGSWSVNLPAGALQGLADGSYPVSAELSDKALNSTSVTQNITIDASPATLPTLTISAVSGDNYINQAEAGQVLAISGTSTNLEAGRTVSVVLNGKTYTATVDASGGWSTNVPAADAGALADGAQTITASATDTAGNPASNTHNVTVIAAAADQPTLNFNPVSGDDIINAQESNSNLIISGTSQRIPAGGNVLVTLDGKTYNATVDANGNWSTTVPAADVRALDQGSNTVTASSADVAGNPANASHNFTVDTVEPLLSVTLDAGDVLNLAEALAGLLVSGQTEAGLTVTVTLNNKEYSATADVNGAWSLTIPSGDLLLLQDGELGVGVSVTDRAGNTSTDVVNLDVLINALPVLNITTPFVDGLLNAAESLVAQTITGTSSNLAVGTAVVVTIGGLTFNGTVTANNVWSVNIPAGSLAGLSDGQLQVEVSAVDTAGNPATATVSADVLINTLPDATILTPFVDGLLNAAEAGVNQLISGTTGITGSGQTVTLKIDNTTFTTTVDQNGNWSATLTPTQLAALGNGTHTIDVTVTDRAQNSDSTTLGFNAIITGLPQPTLATPFVDGFLNAAEAAVNGALTGTTGITGAQTVKVTLNGTTYDATVDATTGAWNLPLSSGLLQSLQDGNLPISVVVTDAAGNVGNTSGSLTVAVNSLPNATINLPFGDGALNIDEAAVSQLISGKTGVVGAGQSVSVLISGFNGDNPLNATVDANGNWSLSLTPTQLATLANGTHSITVTARDAAGNSDVETLNVTTALTLPEPVINTPFIDGVLNITEAGAAVTLTGRTGVDGLNQGVQLKIDVNGISYTGTVDASGNWSVNIPAGALSGLTNGTHTINVTVTDSAGNTNSESLNFTASLTAPVPTLNLPFTDGYLNAAEALAGGVLSGKTGVTGAGQSVSVTIAGTTYTGATVDNNGNWTLNVGSGVLSALGQGTASVAVQATDSAGNVGAINGSFTVDTQVPTITITPFTGDNALTYLESLTTQTLGGTTTGASIGSVVTVTIGTATLSGVVQANGSWTVNVTPAAMLQLGTTSGTISASVSDIAGNVGNSSATVTVDLTPPPAPLVTLTPVGGDNIINVADGTGNVTLAGTYGNIGTAGGTVTVTINGALAGTAVVSTDDGSWSISVPNTSFIDGNAVVSVTASGLDGSATSNSTVVVDRVPPVLTIGAFTGDNVLNGSEATATQTINGTASLSEAGRTVSVTLNGKTYTAVVQANGSWSAAVPAADLQALGQGAQTISATLSDAAGNPGTATHAITVDTGAPLLQVDALLGDNVLNAADILLTQTLTGRATGAEGQTIGLYLGDGAPIATAVVNANGTFSIDLTPQVLGSLTDGALVFGVRVSDAAGNQTDATLTVNKVVNSALNLVVDTLFGDGFLNAADTAVAQTISGITTSAGVGATVALTIGGTTLTAAVGQDGKWAIVVPPTLLDVFNDGNIALQLTLTDAYGNTSTVDKTFTAIVDNLPQIGALTGLFGGDNLLNIVESTVEQTVKGVVTAATGSTVTVTLGSKSYAATVNALGEWSIKIPPLDLGALTDGTLALGVKVVDPAGNTTSTSVDVGIFTAQPSITLSPIFGDGILNIADLATGQIISGVVNNVAAGSTITLGIGGNTVTAEVGANGAFSATVSPDILGTLTSGNLTISASVTDAAGNTASASQGLVVDVIRPVVNLATLFGDGLLNAADALLTQTITGTVSGAEAGSRVVVTIGGQQFVTATTGNSFSLALTPAILQGLLDGNLTVGVAVTDSAGNTGSATAGAIVGIHNLPVITLNPLFGDGILNLVESLVTQTITGTVTNAAGSTVRINIGNSTVTAQVGSDGKFSATVAPDILGTLLNGNLTVGVSVTDAVGNTTGVSAGVQVGISNPPTLTLNTVFGDGVLSAADLNSTQTISGSSSNLAVGSTVSVTLGGKSYSALVASGGAWSVSVSKADLALLSNGNLTVNASATDAYGNVATKSGSVSVITNTPPTVSISAVFGDGLLNATDAQSAQTITGTTTNAEGSTVTVKVGSSLTLTGTVAANGTWSVSVPSASLIALADGTQNVTATVTNAAGNSGSGSSSASVITHSLPSVALGVLFTDGYLNLSEASATETITGTSTNAVGSRVSVDVAGTVYTTTVLANGTWSVNVPSSTLRGISDGSHTVLVTLTDPVGNTSVAGSSFTAKTHDLPVVGVDPVLALVNVLLNGLTVSGGTLNLAQGTRVNVTLNGSTMQATTDALGRYSVKFAGGLLTALNLNSIVTVTAVDVAGNPASTTTTLLLGSLLPVATAATSSLALFSVAADDATSVDTHALAATAASHEETAKASSSTETSATTTVESTLTTDADSATSAATATSSESTTATTDETASTAADDSSYTIGGVVITLADGTTHEGATVTGSLGDDTVTVNNLNFEHIDGGAGTDTLVLGGEHMALDLTALGLKVEHIEVLDLGASGTNSVKLDLNEALKLTDTQNEDLLIKGADGSQVTLSNTDGGVWATVGQRTVDGQVFDVYHNSALTSDNSLGDVLVQHNLQVHVV